MPVKKLIERIEVGAGGAASITFSAIPQTYTHLLLVVSARTVRGIVVDEIRVRPNNLTANLSQRALQGSGSGASSFSDSSMHFVANANTATSNTFGNATIFIPNYAGNTAKSVSIDSVSENNGTEAYQRINAALWNDTAAITSLVLDSLSANNFLQYSSASLYGITRGSDGTTTVS